jgi:PadR family transcriptional regulator, regulatory protein PadR
MYCAAAMAKQSNPDFLNGVPELLVLQLLARRAMYGYELVRAIEHASKQVFEFGEGCIYPVLHRLEKEGHLTSRRETVGGRSRVVYRVTASGRKRLESQIAVWQSVSGAVQKILHGEKSGKPAIA